MVNLPLLWISALFYVALASALYVGSAGIAWAVLRINGRGKLPSLTQAGRKRVLLAGLLLPPVLAVVPTIAGATLRHMHTGAQAMAAPRMAPSNAGAGSPFGSFSPEQTVPLEHHAMACQQLFDRLALLGGLGMSGNLGRTVSIAVGGAAWLLVVAGLFLAARLLWATLRLERGIEPLLASPTPKLGNSLERVKRSCAALPRQRFFECAIPAAYSSVLGLWQARCVLSAQLVADAPDEELDAVVAHEGSHLRSGDVYATFLVGFLNCIFFFLRPVRLLSRLWREAAELGADDAAVRATRDPLAMASAILRVSGVKASLLPAGLPAVALPFADEAACSPAKRVERLLNQAQKASLLPAAETHVQVAAGWIATGMFALVGVGLLLSSEAACVAHCALELVQHFL